MITVLAGGVGAAKFLSALQQVVDPSEIVAIVNTGDDFQLHGLSICPDLDTVRYTLANDVGQSGWGRADESWRTMTELAAISDKAPNGSRATDWFSLGDRDLATHLYRSQRLTEGASLTTVTRELCNASGVKVELVPMTDDKVATVLTLTSGEVVDFQEYFVKRKHQDAVQTVAFEGAETAKPSRRAIEAIEQAERLIIAPSNPILSIGPIMALAELAATIRSRRAISIAISPIVNGKALKGPADHLLTELGGEASVAGIAQMWHSIARYLVIDSTDKDHRIAVEDTGMEPIVGDTIMSDTATAQALARRVMDIVL